MHNVQLIHNPTAGDEEHKRESLLAQIKAASFECRYSSTKEAGWKKTIDKDAELIAIAGGDGTVRKVVKQLFKQKLTRIPIAVLGLGTANNIAKAFGAYGNTEDVIQNWKNAQIKKVDIGLVQNVPGIDFFLEGFGFGIFPYLMKEMQKLEEEFNSPEEELKAAQKKLHKILMDYEPRRCQLEVDGTDHSGKFFMVEVMNIRSIGPNMVLAPMADAGDGELDVVLVPEAHKEKFSDFLLHKLSGGGDTYQFHTLKAKNIIIRWDGTRLHADDEMLKMEREVEVKISVKEGALQFIIPQDESANR